MDEQDLELILKRPGYAVKGEPTKVGATSKYHNQRTQYNGRWYDSIKEAEAAKRFDLEVRSGVAVCWIPQVTFPLPGGTFHRVDFLVFYRCADRESLHGAFYEVKGRDLAMGRLKRKQVEEIYKVRITVI